MSICDSCNNDAARIWTKPEVPSPVDDEIDVGGRKTTEDSCLECGALIRASLLNRLVRIANMLDAKDLRAEADMIDRIIGIK